MALVLSGSWALLGIVAGVPWAAAQPQATSGTGAMRQGYSIAVGGDVMFGRWTQTGWAAHEGLPSTWADVFRSSDLAFVNLEMGVCRRGRTQSALPLLWAPPERLDVLEAAGVDVVSVANNHALDCGRDGLEGTLEEVRRRGMVAVGVAPAGTARVRSDVVVLAATLHPLPYFAGRVAPLVSRDGAGLVERVAVLRREGPLDLLLVSAHWGRERAREPSVGQRRLASALVEAGANAVIGHGSHTRQVVEEDGDSLVLFGLGNLVFDDVSAVGHPEPPVVLNCARTEEGWRVRPR